MTPEQIADLRRIVAGMTPAEWVNEGPRIAALRNAADDLLTAAERVTVLEDLNKTLTGWLRRYERWQSVQGALPDIDAVRAALEGANR